MSKNEIYNYTLDLVLEHLNIVAKRFQNISKPSHFVESEQGVLLLDSIVTRLQS